MKVYIHCILDGNSPWELRRGFLSKVVLWQAKLGQVTRVLTYGQGGDDNRDIDTSLTLQALVEKADICAAFCGRGSAGFGDLDHGVGKYLRVSDKPTIAFYETWDDIGNPAYKKPELTFGHVWSDGEDVVATLGRAIYWFRRTTNLMRGLPVEDSAAP